MKKFYTVICFLIAFSWQYLYAQTAPIISWPLDASHSTGGIVLDGSNSSDGQLWSPAGIVLSASYRLNNRGDKNIVALGSDQYIAMPDYFGAFNSTTVPKEITISFWMYHDPTDVSRRSIFSAGKGLGLDIDKNTLILKRKESHRDNKYSEFPIVESTSTFKKNDGDKWYYVSLSYHKYYFKLYVGKYNETEMICSYQWLGSFEQQWENINSQLSDVGEINASTRFFLGSKKTGISSIVALSDFLVYGVALSREEINNLFLADTHPQNTLLVSKNGIVGPTRIMDAKVGDEIQFTIIGSLSSTPPVIENLPQSWIARSAGDLRYFVNGSFKPGLSKPWIGFDTQVHWLNLRNYEQEAGRVNYPTWITTPGLNGRYNHMFKYVVNTPMKAYTAPPGRHEWDKFSRHEIKNDAGKPAYDKHKIFADNGNDKQVWLQRANQKEGLNMQILHYWNTLTPTQIPDYTAPYAGPDFMMGFDDDEILYLKSPCHDSGVPCPGVVENQRAYAILTEPLNWQTVPVTESASEDETVNAMVSAHYQVRGEFAKGERFPGNEIQDYNTTDAKPEGDGTWMHQNGNIKITLPGENITYKVGIDAESPLKSFYTLEGPTVVARNEKVDFTLSPFDESVNFKAIIDNYVLGGYEVTLEYETQDSFGSLKRGCDIPPAPAVGLWTSASGNRTSVCTHQVYSTSAGKTKNAIGPNPFESMVDNQPLVFKIKTFGDSYCSVSLYLNKTDNDPTRSVRILLAGKEVHPINLAFMEDQNLVNGTGEGGYFFVEQQRSVEIPFNENNSNGNFNMTRGDKFVNPFVRTYTFYHGQSSKWKVWDSDPHMFGGPTPCTINQKEELQPDIQPCRDRVPRTIADHDWYQGTKKLMVRLHDEDIAEGHLVKYYFDPLSRDVNHNGYLDTAPDGLGNTEVRLGSPVSTSRFWDITYTLSNYPAGEYQLTAIFRDGPPIQHKVIIKEERTLATNPVAEIKSYSLGTYDKALLTSAGMSFQNGVQYRVLEIANISSQLMYLVGERNNYQNGLTGLANVVDSKASKLAKVNRWGPFNDFNARFYWRKSSNQEFISLPVFEFKDAMNDWNFDLDGQRAMQGTSNKDYNRLPAPKFPSLWGNHFSSLWKEQGPDGSAGPKYRHTSGLKEEHEIDFAPYFNELGSMGDPHYWQYRATLNSWADSYGYRMRYNPSHIYSLAKVFDPANGAFSGAAVPGQYADDKSSKPRQPYPSDNFLNMQAWYWNLTMGRKIIVDETTYQAIKNDIRIFNDYNVEYGKLSNATTYASTNLVSMTSLTVNSNPRNTIGLCSPCALTEVTYGSGGRLASVEDVKSDDLKIDAEFTPSLTVYPNTVSFYEQINVDVVATQLSPMHFAVYDLSGRVIHEESSFVDRGVNRFTLDAATLGVQTEMIVIKVTTSELDDSKKIIVTRSVDNK